MVQGVGGSSFGQELARLTPMAGAATPITVDEYQARTARAQSLMREQGIDALYLDTSTNLRYFTGVALTLTERLHGAVIPAHGEIAYLSPTFEEPKTREYLKFGDDIRTWQEHEDPTATVIDTVRSLGADSIAPGMCFSIEPTICIYGEFGVRLEDIVHMTEQGPRWFTQPCPSVEDPFGITT